MDTAKLARLQAAAKKKKDAGGKGLARSKVQKAPTGAGAGDDKKLQAALKKLPVQNLAGVEEVNMFQDNSRILHFSGPKVHAAANSNTYAVYGTGQDKDLTELVPGIIPQLGPDSLASLRKMAESYGSMKNQTGGIDDDDDDDVPDLVDSFDVAVRPTKIPATADPSADSVQEPHSENKLEELE